jgi:hypothetical protein
MIKKYELLYRDVSRNRREPNNFDAFILFFYVLDKMRPVVNSNLMASFYKPYPQLLIKRFKAAIPGRNTTGAEEGDFHKNVFMMDFFLLILLLFVLSPLQKCHPCTLQYLWT